MNNKYLILVSVVAVILVGVWIANEYLYDEPKGATYNNSTYVEEVMDEEVVNGDMVEEEMADDSSEVKVSVAGQNFSFSAKEIRVKQGDVVELTFSSTGGLHDWRVDEFGAKTKMLNSGESDTIKFIADKAGTFEYYCNVGNHRELGMVGKLIVE